jgi:hypothetical protein
MSRLLKDRKFDCLPEAHSPPMGAGVGEKKNWDIALILYRAKFALISTLYNF